MTQEYQSRAGVYIRQASHYEAFIPAHLPPVPPVDMSPELQVKLSLADRAIGRLDSITDILPNPDLFVSMYVRREAVYSSQIEGTQASLVDLLKYEADAARNGREVDLQEIVNYVKAMNYGFARLKEIPISLRLIREIHAKLLEGVRGSEREPGEFRRSQNWIGPPGSSPSDAIFVPPPPNEVLIAMGNLESFLHDETPMPILIKCGLAHAQFETIHPFLDGNGRMGRLLITFLLCWKRVLKRPLLYISGHFKMHREEYYDRLQAVRDRGDWEGWMDFFLSGIDTVAQEATQTAHRILTLREEHRTLVGHEVPRTPTAQLLLDSLIERPFLKVKQVADVIGRSKMAAGALVAKFEKLGLLEEVTGKRRNRVYAYQPYLKLLE